MAPHRASAVFDGGLELEPKILHAKQPAIAPSQEQFRAPWACGQTTEKKRTYQYIHHQGPLQTLGAMVSQ